VLLAQLSDLHVTHPGRLVSGVVDTTAYLDRALARLAALTPQPDALVITGDLVDLGTAEEYVVLRDRLAPLAMPVHLLLGNHDHRDAFRAVFGGPDGFVQYAVDVGPVRLIALDTLDPSHPRGGGRLCDDRLGWLADQLVQTRGPVIVAMHHPPFATGIAFMDSALVDADGSAKLAAVLARHPNVERVICGHVHRSVTARFAGTVAAVAPSCAHQVPLALGPDAPPGFVLEPPAFALHLWNGTLVSHLVPIEPAGATYGF
jgi:3',5'-cyclic AMP phosphodiesterase CpdA